MATTSTTKHTPAVAFVGDAGCTEALQKIPLSDFPAPKDGVIVVDSTATVLEACKILCENNILSAPVRDVTKPDDATWYEKYLGLVDLSDIVHFFCDALEGKYDGRPSFLEAMHSNDVVKTVKVTEILHVFKFGPFVPLEATDNLLDAVLVLGKHGLHRLCVIETGGDIINFITQSAMIVALKNALPALSAVASKTLTELGLSPSSSPVVSVGLKDGVWHALQLMRTHNISGLPIVGEDGAVVGVFSNRDVRDIIRPRGGLYPHLFRTVHDFLVAKAAREVDAKALTVTAKPSDTLRLVVEKLAALRLHRLVVIDSSNHPIGIVSLSDVLSVLAIEPAGYFGDFFDE